MPQTAMGAGTAGKQAATATAAAPAPGPATASAPAASSGQKEQEPGNGNTTAHSNDKANAEVASLKPGIVPQDLVTALNDSAITFPSSSAEVPQSARDFLTKAAGDLKQLPPGYVLEIAGYTDDSGDAAINRRLSQRRADAVRDALIAGGAKPDMLMAKGYGSADPIASNDTPEGRARNRRIEYRVVKQR